MSFKFPAQTIPRKRRKIESDYWKKGEVLSSARKLSEQLPHFPIKDDPRDTYLPLYGHSDLLFRMISLISFDYLNEEFDKFLKFNSSDREYKINFSSTQRFAEEQFLQQVVKTGLDETEVEKLVNESHFEEPNDEDVRSYLPLQFTKLYNEVFRYHCDHGVLKVGDRDFCSFCLNPTDCFTLLGFVIGVSDPKLLMEEQVTYLFLIRVNICALEVMLSCSTTNKSHFKHHETMEVDGNAKENTKLSGYEENWHQLNALNAGRLCMLEFIMEKYFNSKLINKDEISSKLRSHFFVIWALCHDIVLELSCCYRCDIAHPFFQYLINNYWQEFAESVGMTLELEDLLDFKKIRKVGEGANGKVFKYLSWEDEWFAIKILREGKEVYSKRYPDIWRECLYLKELKHPNLVEFDDPLYDLTAFPMKCFLKMELCSQDLSTWLRRREETSTELSPHIIDHPENLSIAYQILKALHYLHSNDVVHRDLRADNVFFAEGTGVVKLGDYGNTGNMNAYLSAEGKINMSKPGVYLYLSFESLRRGFPVTGKVDMYSFGIVLFELYSLYMASDKTSHGEKCRYIQHFKASEDISYEYIKPIDNFDHPNPFEEVAEKWPSIAKSIKLLLNDDQNERPSASELLYGIKDTYEMNYELFDEIEYYFSALEKTPMRQDFHEQNLVDSCLIQ